MPSNIEIKARISREHAEIIRAAARARSSGEPAVLWQRDTFYQAASGRLKLRELRDGTAELIAYERPDRAGPKPSSYTVYACTAPGLLHEVLARSLGVRGIVEKRREVIHVGQTRVHLDDVVALGTFLELEVVLVEGQTPEMGEAVARELLAAFAVAPSALVAGAYMDLLEAGGHAASAPPTERPGGNRDRDVAVTLPAAGNLK